ncbi:MAG: pyridoxal-phosphate dependent enzyme, partial [Pandoraea sp.]|nr:pyridoxal-phosphate dependent enzyme [Pandoraea sp.]
REGKKTCAFEMAEALDWRVPDWVIVPTGDGNILSGIAAGFLDLYSLGITSAMPRLLAAQADSASSITRDWRACDDAMALPASPTQVSPDTVADSLAVGRPRDHFAALHALRATRGACVALSDARIMAAARNLAQRFGLWFEPSTAAGYAALGECLATGRIEPRSRVVLLGTGSGLKSPQCFDAVTPGQLRGYVEAAPRRMPDDPGYVQSEAQP